MDKALATELAKYGATHVLGIDESGTGAWAGSFYVASFLGPLGWNLKGVRDSKKTKAKERLKLVELISDDVDVAGGIGAATVELITKFGHTGAYLRAFREAVTEAANFMIVDKKKIVVVMDGLYQKQLAAVLKQMGFLNILFIVKADDKVPHVSAASIFAKFNRDCEMNLLDKKFPGYGFVQHAGYGTLLHRQRIAERGLIPNVHRPRSPK